MGGYDDADDEYVGYHYADSEDVDDDTGYDDDGSDVYSDND